MKVNGKLVDGKLLMVDSIMKKLKLKEKEFKVPLELLKQTAKMQRLPVVNFAAGGIATPADAALMMQLGCDGVFVGSGIFTSENPKKRAQAIVDATMNFQDPKILAAVSEDLGSAMDSLPIEGLHVKMAERGW